MICDHYSSINADTVQVHAICSIPPNVDLYQLSNPYLLLSSRTDIRSNLKMYVCMYRQDYGHTTCVACYNPALCAIE